MVKLAVCTATVDPRKDKIPLKQPLDDTVEVPLGKQTVVHMRTEIGPCTKRTAVGVVIATLILLAIGGALACVYFRRHQVGRQCIDWGPGCEMDSPPKEPYHDGPEAGNFHDGPDGRKGEEGDNHGGEMGHSDGDREGHETGHHTGHHKGGHDGDPDRAERRGPAHHDDHDRYHPRHERPRPHHRPKYREYPPGRAGPQGDNDGHPRPKHHKPLP